MYLLLIFCWHAVFNLHYSMPHCMVLNCSNGWRKTKGTNITYHRVPSKHMKNVWLQKIRRDNARDVKHSFVVNILPLIVTLPRLLRHCVGIRGEQHYI